MILIADVPLQGLHKENAMKVRQISPECGIGMCPTVFQISPDCGLGACATVFEAEGDLIIVGTVLTAEELGAVAHKVKSGEEMAVRVPKSLIAGLKI